MNAVDGTHAAVANLRDDAIRAGEGVAFFDRDIGFGSLKLVLQFTTIKTNCSYSTSILLNSSSLGLAILRILFWPRFCHRNYEQHSLVELAEEVFGLAGSTCQGLR